MDKDERRAAWKKLYQWQRNEALSKATARIQRNGGKIDKRARTIKLDRLKPGIKLWGALDCLVHYDDFFLIKEF